MKAEGISTLNLHSSLRLATVRAQASLNRAQIEYASGRHYDVGLSLGSSTTQSLNWRNQISAYQQKIDISKVASTRAAMTQTGIDKIKEVADSFIKTLTGARTAQNGQSIATEAAKTAYDAIQQILSTSFDGQYIYSGLNSTSSALNAYAGSTAQSSLESAFLSYFGFSADSPAAINITPSQLQNFLQTNFSQEFDDPSWSANWSSADPSKPTVAGEGNARIDLSMSASNDSIRRLVKSVTSVMSIAKGELNSSTFSELTDEALSEAASSIQGLGEEQSRIGIGQEELKHATERMTLKSDLLKAQVQEIEGVDPQEAALRLSQAMTQLEASYAITAKISRLTLTNYL